MHVFFDHDEAQEGNKRSASEQPEMYKERRARGHDPYQITPFKFRFLRLLYVNTVDLSTLSSFFEEESLY